MVCMEQGIMTMEVLYSRRGWPTSIVLLLLVVVTQLSLTLSCHSPLRLHHLLGFIRAARGLLLALGGIEVLCGSRERTTVVEITDRVVARRTAGHARN